MREVKNRIKDYNEIYSNYDFNTIKPLLDECHNCSEPFCSNKLVINNTITGCPINININKVISLMKYNLYDEAYKELTKNNPFPEITSRVCKGYCEYACINSKESSLANIKDILRTLADYGLDNFVKYDIKEKKNKNVTIIGSGASGLACADYLIKEGYNVTIYEKNNLPGGTLMYGISNMILDKSILNKRINYLKEAGVNFICDSEVTRVISPMDVLKNCDALVIASGVVKRTLAIKGMGLKNVMYATDYLKKVTNNILTKGISDISENKSVLILGCGATTDEVISYCIREHAKMVACIDYKNMPPLKRTTSWPYPDDSMNPNWAIQEARSKMFMDPRSYNMTVKEFVGSSFVESAKIAQVKWENNKAIIMEQTQEFPVDLVIVSIGNIGYEEDLINYFDIDIVNKLVNESNHKNNKNVFICGDALINNGITACAIEDGIKCAKEVKEYLEA